MPDDPLALFGRFGAALAVGLLVGTQREFQHQKENAAKEAHAGIRTFPLVALAGGMGAYLAGLTGGGLVLAVVVGAVGLMGVAAYRAAAGRGDVGLTTEVALLGTVLAGALCVAGALAVAVALGVTMAVLLELKPESRRFVRALDEQDVAATLKFAAVSALVLPVLPDRAYGPPPFDVLSPFKVWLMVVFISGISFLGYVLVKVVGPRRGVGLTGIVGGLASSTAVTLSFAARSKHQGALSGALALGIVAAWTVMFGRVLVEAGVVNPALLRVLWPAIVAGGVAALAWAGVLYARGDRTAGDEPDAARFSNPFELRSALAFGALYALILVGARAAGLYLGTAGVYASALASGLADVDAVTLTMAELSARGELDLGTARHAVVLAAASNTAVKGGLVLALGAPALRRAILPGLVLVLAAMLGVGFLL